MSKLSDMDGDRTNQKPSRVRAPEKAREYSRNDRHKLRDGISEYVHNAASATRAKGAGERNILAKDNTRRTSVDDMRRGVEKTRTGVKFMDGVIGLRAGFEVYAAAEGNLRTCFFADMGIGAGFAVNLETSISAANDIPVSGGHGRFALTAGVAAKSFVAGAGLSVEHNFLNNTSRTTANANIGPVVLDLQTREISGAKQKIGDTALDRIDRTFKSAFGASAEVAVWPGLEYCFDSRERD